MAYITFQPSDYFDTKIYTQSGSNNNGNTQTITMDNVGFTWIKNRDYANAHALFDKIRGGDKLLATNGTAAAETVGGGITFGASSTTIGADTGGYGFNNRVGDDYVAWHWRADGTTGSSNTDGSITSTVSANTTSGFSIIKYTGSGSASTVGHGLGAAPDVTIRKKLNTSDDWYVHTTLIDGSFDFLRLNTTAAKSDSSLTGFTSTTVGVAASSYEEIIYAFKSIKGFSKIGTYVGNGNADGPFVYTGFKPAFLLFKGNNTSDWQLFDNKRDPENPVERALHPDINNTASTDQELDFTSNGFKIRDTGAHFNGSGVSFFYIAFAESPLIGTNNVPVTAR